ncbi:hypothetical protein [Clostridium cellulovorans]|nr:hypothetical protein [Clostridium cellulovorans]
MITKRTNYAIIILTFITVFNGSTYKLIKAFYKSNLFFFILCILLLALGFKENTIFLENNRTVYTLGFVNPNTAASKYLIILLSYIYLKYKKLNVLNYTFISLSSIVIYILTGSRTGATSTLILIFFLLISKAVKKKNTLILTKKLLNKLYPYTFIIFSILSILLVVNYGKYPFINTIDKLFTNRIMLASKYCYDIYSITFLGGAERYLSDNMYLYLTFDTGLIGLALYAIYYLILVKKILKKKDVAALIIVLSILFFGLTECSTVFIANNCTLLMSNFIFTSKAKKTSQPSLSNKTS